MKRIFRAHPVRAHLARFALMAGGVAVLSISSSAQTAGTSSSASSPDQQKGTARPAPNSSGASRPSAQGPTSATGSGYHSGVASADADAAREINAANARKTPGERLSSADRRFLVKASDAGFAQTQTAELAAKRATAPSVKAFAETLVQAHGAFSTDLVTLGNQKDVLFEKDAVTSRAYNRLDRKTGAAFDQEFLEYIADGHEDTIKLFEKAATGATDPDVKAFAAGHVGQLRQHLQQAQALQKSSSGSPGAARRTNGATSASGASTPASTAPAADSATKRDSAR